MKRVSFKTVGCRLNQAETALMAAEFEAEGYDVVPFERPADVCVIHTCTVTARAEQTVVRLARGLRRRVEPPFVILAGCAVEIHRRRLEQLGVADMLAGQSEKFGLPARLNKRTAPAAEAPPRLTPRFTTARALIRVQDGCDFRCAYCVVPDTRGVPRSRPFDEVLDEVRAVTSAGHREVVITGANLACYRDGPRSLVDLLKAIQAVPGVERMRISSIEMAHTETDLVHFMAQSPTLCHYLHLPLQSGDDGILRAMRRRYTAGEYRAMIETAADRVPDLGLGTDLIVGFPGEDEPAFENTYRLIEALPFSNLHVFAYSRREGTPAAALPDPVPETVKAARVRALIELGERKRAAFAQRFIGRPVTMLIERVDAQGRGHGWTSEYVEAVAACAPDARKQLITFTVRSCADAVLHDG